MSRIAVLGAGGLIGHALALNLQHRGFTVWAYARRFTGAQAFALAKPVQQNLTILSDEKLRDLLTEIDIVVNCLGVLQGPESDAVHHAFAARLAACCAPDKLLFHFSVPGDAETDSTPFSLTKRAGEQAIAASGAPFVILRPGFVVAASAYGGSAMVRALAALPLALPRHESAATFAAIAMDDICETLARVVVRWRDGERSWSKVWDVMELAPGTLGDAVAAFRVHFGGPRPLWRIPGFLMGLGARAGDVSAWLGWRPPVRSTAIAELRRGIAGDPGGWIKDTGIAPLSLRGAVAAIPATVQERWFARLYLFKALALASLVLFWCVSGTIALTVGFHDARAILLSHGFAFGTAHWLTVISSVQDICVGLAIACRRTSRIGLAAGIIVSLGYMVLAAILTPELWGEPLGALVKTGPAIVLMLFCLAVTDDR